MPTIKRNTMTVGSLTGAHQRSYKLLIQRDEALCKLHKVLPAKHHDEARSHLLTANTYDINATADAIVSGASWESVVEHGPVFAKLIQVAINMAASFDAMGRTMRALDLIFQQSRNDTLVDRGAMILLWVGFLFSLVMALW